MEHGLPRFNCLIIIAILIFIASLIGLIVPLLSSIQEKQKTLNKKIAQRHHEQQKQQNQLNHIKGMYTFVL